MPRRMRLPSSSPRSTARCWATENDQLEIAAGAGTLAEEILNDEPSIDTIVVAVSGGGLCAGVAAAAAARARAVAVESTTIPTMRKALDRSRPVDVPVSGVAADSLGALLDRTHHHEAS